MAAKTFSWQVATSGNWDVNSNWTPGGGPPGTVFTTFADTAVVSTTSGVYTVTYNVAADTIGALTISSSTATLQWDATAGRALTVTGATKISLGTLDLATTTKTGSSLSTGSLAVSGGTFESGNTVSVTGLAQFSGGIGAISGGTFGAGTLAQSGGALTLSGGTTKSTGATTLSGGKLTINSTGSLSTASLTSSNNIFLQSAGNVTDTGLASFTGGTDTISGGAFNAGTVAIGNSLTLSGGTITSTTAGVTISSGKIVTLSGIGDLNATTGGLVDSGTLLGSGTVDGAITGNGSIEAKGGTLTLNAASLDSTLTVTVDGSSGLVSNGTGNAGTFNLAGNSSVLSLGGNLSTGSSVNFAGSAFKGQVLDLTSPTNNGTFSAVTNFSFGDSLILNGFSTATHAVLSSGSLLLEDNSNTVLYTIASFTDANSSDLIGVSHTGGNTILSLSATGNNVFTYSTPGDDSNFESAYAWLNPNNWTGGTPTTGQNLDLATNFSGGKASVDNIGSLSVVTLTASSGLLIIDSGSALSVSEQDVLSAGGTIDILGTLNVNELAGNAVGATIELDGGHLDTAIFSEKADSTTDLSGFGTLSGGPLSGPLTVTASGGSLAIKNDIISGPTFVIADVPGSVLDILGNVTAVNAIALDTSNKTLEIGSGGTLTITPAQTVSGGTLKLDSSSSELVASSGLTVSSGTFTETDGTANISDNADFTGGTGSIAAGSFTAGTITVNGGALTLSGGTAASGGAVTLSSGSLAINTAGTLDAASLDAFGGTLFESGGVVDVSGVASLGAGTEGVSSGTFSAGTLNVVGAALTLSGGTTTSSGAVTLLSGSLTINNNNGTLDAGSLDVSGGTFSQSAGTVGVGSAEFKSGLDAVVGGVFGAGTLTVDGAANVLTLSGGTITIGQGGGTIATGDQILIQSDGATLDASTSTLAVNGALNGFGVVEGTITGPGVVNADGGKLELTSDVTNLSPSFEISDAGSSILQLDGTVAAGNMFTFQGTAGELDFTNSAKLTQNIVGLDVSASAGDATNFINVVGTDVTVTDGFMGTGTSGAFTLSNGDTFTLNGITDSTGNWFVNTSVVGGSTEIFLDDNPCYAAGTRILTATGERMIESLMKGDIVLTLSGGELQTQPIKWVGRRRVDLTAHPRPETVAPIRIGRGAFADDMPHTDLVVSPDHAIFVDGKLICARQLVNGTTIRQEQGWTSVDYFHVELDAHAILLAEGLPAESYLNTGNHGFFANSGEPLMLHPDLTDETDYPAREAGSCAPFVWDEANVYPVWQRLADRAAALGQPMPHAETTDDAQLRVLAKGRFVRPMYAENGLYIFRLPKGTTAARLVSRASAPTDSQPWLDDRRRLGVYVARIVVWGAGDNVQELPVDHPSLSEGWWAVEGNGMTLRRWTNGNAVLPLPALNGPTMLEVHASSSGMSYIINADQDLRAA
jgi:collagen type I/II/III/V/XI/XXIV/XXVII alpha